MRNFRIITTLGRLLKMDEIILRAVEIFAFVLRAKVCFFLNSLVIVYRVWLPSGMPLAMVSVQRFTPNQ